MASPHCSRCGCFVAANGPCRGCLTGGPQKRLAPFETLVEKREDGCWIWIGPQDGKGYGKYGRKLAHRYSYEIAKGAIPPGLAVCHSCDTPLCVNPAHLWVGTQADNMRDANAKGRGKAALNAAKTHCVRGHEFAPENTRRVGPKRWCRKCDAIRTRAYKERKAAGL